MHQLPETGYLRLPQIIGNPKAVPPMLGTICRQVQHGGLA